MATHSGHEGLVKVSTNTIAEIVSYSYEETADVFEDTELSDGAKSFVVGQTGWSGSAECHFDESDTSGQGALDIGSSVTLALYPEGDTSGDTYRTGTALVTNRSVSGGGGDTVKISFSFQGTGALTESTVA